MNIGMISNAFVCEKWTGQRMAGSMDRSIVGVNISTDLHIGESPSDSAAVVTTKVHPLCRMGRQRPCSYDDGVIPVGLCSRVPSRQEEMGRGGGVQL